MMILDAKPNPAHLKLAELEKAGKLSDRAVYSTAAVLAVIFLCDIICTYIIF